MYRETPAKIVRSYALPQMVGLLLNSLYFIVDGIFIGNRLGRDAMAAAAVAVPVIEILIALALLVSSGAGIPISGMLGRGERAEANRMFNLAAVVLATVGGVIVVFGNLFLGRLASFLGATPDIHSEAVTYLRYIVSFSPFLLFSFLLSSLARNDNRPKLAMAALAAGAVSNIILDYVFLYPLHMGIAGAALATALGPIFSILILLPHFLRRKGVLYFQAFRRPPGGIRQILALGFPEFITEFTIGIVTFFYNFAVIQYGYDELALAAYLILGYLSLIILTLFLGIAQGLQPVFSYYSGSGEGERSRALLSFSKKMVLGVGIFAYLLVLLLSRRFAAIFAAGDLELIQFTSGRAAVYFWGFLFAGYNILMISFWQSVKKTGRALFFSLLRSVMLLPALMLLLPALWGREMLWLCHSLTETVCAAAAAVLWAVHRRDRRRSGQPVGARPR